MLYINVYASEYIRNAIKFNLIFYRYNTVDSHNHVGTPSVHFYIITCKIYYLKLWPLLFAGGT